MLPLGWADAARSGKTARHSKDSSAEGARVDTDEKARRIFGKHRAGVAGFGLV
jgi:hypothetical protein